MSPAATPDGAASALLHALLLEDPDRAIEAGRRYLDGVDLQVIPWSQARLLPTLYKRLADLGEPAPPLLRGTYRKAWTQNQARFRAVVPTLEALTAAGIDNLVLKGAALVPAYGGDWGVRDMSDVDLLVDRAHLARAAEIIDAQGWRPTRGLTTAGVLARFEYRRHSWNLEHADGHQLDLHWRVFADSRGPRSDRAFFEASVPLELGSVRVRRMGDADLLLHVLEHGTHEEVASKLQWVVDAVKVLRATDDVTALADRLATQASEHGLLEPIRERVARITLALDEPAAALLLARLDREGPRRLLPSGSWRRRIDEHRRGGAPVGSAALSLAREVADSTLARRRAAWLAYVASGRRPRVERALGARGGPLTTTPGAPVPEPDEDGWWHLDAGATVEALCGPGWSYPEPGQGTWVEGTEGRLSLPIRRRPSEDGAELVVELVLTVLGRFGGPSREVQVRADGRTLVTLISERDNSGHHLRLPVPVPDGPNVEVSLLVHHPGRPDELGIGPDPRRLGVMVHRVRVRSSTDPIDAVDGAAGTAEGNGRRVLVTGSRGLIGGALADHMRKAGWRVRGFDLKTGDDLRDEWAVLDAMRGCEVVVHVAAIPHDTAGTPADIVETNVLGTWHVLLAAERLGVSRVVVFSSAQVFGFADGEGRPMYQPVDDDHPLRATRPYGMSKRLVEDMCEAWTARTGIPTVVLRPVLVLDEGRLARSSAATVEMGTYVHLDDVVDASVRAVEVDLDGHHRVTLCGPGPYDTSRAKKVLGWEPTRGWPER